MIRLIQSTLYLCTVCMYLSYRNAALLDQAVITNLTGKTREGGIEEVGIRMGGIRGRGIIICFSLPKKPLHSQSRLQLHYWTIREKAVKLWSRREEQRSCDGGRGRSAFLLPKKTAARSARARSAAKTHTSFIWSASHSSSSLITTKSSFTSGIWYILYIPVLILVI